MESPAAAVAEDAEEVAAALAAVEEEDAIRSGYKTPSCYPITIQQTHTHTHNEDIPSEKTLHFRHARHAVITYIFVKPFGERLIGLIGEELFQIESCLLPQ